MNGKIGFRRNRKKQEITKSYNRREIRESHDHQSHEGTQHIEEGKEQKFKFVTNEMRQQQTV